MADYALYMEAAGVSRKQAITTLNNKYPKFGKATMTMICNPQDYGVQLVSEAERELIDAFGYHSGLAERRRRNDHNRKKKNKLTLRLDDSLYQQLQEVYHRTAFASMQDMLEAAVVEFVNRRM